MMSATRAVREGAIVYLDEVVEARKDTTVVLHPLADDRRILPIERTGEQLKAPPEFMLVISYNPGYQNLLKIRLLARALVLNVSVMMSPFKGPMFKWSGRFTCTWAEVRSARSRDPAS